MTKGLPKQPQILIVDDESVIADTVAQILRQKGYKATATYSGEEAIEAALLNPPALVISDVMMSGMNGIELGVRVRRMFPDCKVILFSGQQETGRLLQAAFTAGNHFVFLQKPVPPQVLIGHVEETFKEHSPNQRTSN